MLALLVSTPQFCSGLKFIIVGERFSLPRMLIGPCTGKKITYIGRGGVDRELIEHVAEVRPRVESVPRRTGADAQQHGGGLQPTVAANVQPIGATDGERTDGAFGFSIVDGESRVVEVTNQRRPLISGIFDGQAEETFWRRGSVLLIEPGGELGQDRPGPRLSPPHHVGVGGRLNAKIEPDATTAKCAGRVVAYLVQSMTEAGVTLPDVRRWPELARYLAMLMARRRETLARLRRSWRQASRPNSR
jgi:hypothetical protein